MYTSLVTIVISQNRITLVVSLKLNTGQVVIELLQSSITYAYNLNFLRKLNPSDYYMRLCVFRFPLRTSFFN